MEEKEFEQLVEERENQDVESGYYCFFDDTVNDTVKKAGAALAQKMAQKSPGKSE